MAINFKVLQQKGLKSSKYLLIKKQLFEINFRFSKFSGTKQSIPYVSRGFVSDMNVR